jgi:hypothetical protein
MSNALAIAGVSAVLEYYLHNMYLGLPTTMFGGTVSVTAQAPDLVQNSLGTLDAAENKVNLFLHQVTYNSGWRDMQLPSLASDGHTLLQSPPLALDLHYLLTVYGSADWQAEGLLGYALMMFHQNPIISRSDIAAALKGLPSGNNLSPYVAMCGLADQVEMIKITPATLGREEMAWLWTALKADYRPTFPFQVSVVLMQPAQSPSLSLPVLQRSIQLQASAPPQILQVLPPNNQVAAEFTDPVLVVGENLSTMTQVQLTNPRLMVQFPVPAPAVNTVITATSLSFITNDQTLLPAVPAGVYSIVAQAADSTGLVVSMSTNSLSVALAPSIPTQTATSVTNPDPTQPNTILVTVTGIAPAVWAGQTATLSLTNLAVPPPPGAVYSISAQAQGLSPGTTSTSLTFELPNTLPLGTPFLARLIVDGVASMVTVSGSPPVFSGPMVTVS